VRDSETSPIRVRVDKWLWAARCFKTRTQATAACDGGHVKLDGVTAKPSRPLKVGQVVEVLTPGGRRVLQVEALAQRRGPARAARGLYIDLTPPEPESDLPRAVRRALQNPELKRKGRPTKRDRRNLDRIKRR